MKNKLYALLIAILLVCGCATQNYSPPVMRDIAPEISAVASQARNTTSSAEKTVVLATVVEKKYKGDQDAYNTVKSAKETVLESKRTETKLAEVQKLAETNDKNAKELEGKYQKAAKEVEGLKKDNQTLKDKIKELGKTIWNQRFIIIGLGVALVAAVAFVLKPWRWV